MKKMLKRLGVVIPSTILTLLMAVGFSTPAFAFVDTTEVMEEPTQVIEEEEPTEEEKIPFTIAGNGEVEDNIVDAFVETETILEKIATQHNAKTICGAGLFPAVKELTADGFLHPNDLGHQVYAQRLAKAMRR